jgi:hypothetical protein
MCRSILSDKVTIKAKESPTAPLNPAYEQRMTYLKLIPYPILLRTGQKMRIIKNLIMCKMT